MTGRLWFAIFLFLILYCGGTAYCKDSGGKGVDMPRITAQQAIDNVKLIIKELETGRGRITKTKKGDSKLEVPLTWKDTIVASIRLNPDTGEILPKGYRVWSPKISVSPEDAAKIVRKIIPGLIAGYPWQSVNGQWKVPLVLKGSVVAEIKVDGKDGKIIPSAR